MKKLTLVFSCVAALIMGSPASMEGQNSSDWYRDHTGRVSYYYPGQGYYYTTGIYYSYSPKGSYYPGPYQRGNQYSPGYRYSPGDGSYTYLGNSYTYPNGQYPNYYTPRDGYYYIQPGTTYYPAQRAVAFYPSQGGQGGVVYYYPSQGAVSYQVSTASGAALDAPPQNSNGYAYTPPSRGAGGVANGSYYPPPQSSSTHGDSRSSKVDPKSPSSKQPPATAPNFWGLPQSSDNSSRAPQGSTARSSPHGATTTFTAKKLKFHKPASHQQKTHAEAVTNGIAQGVEDTVGETATNQPSGMSSDSQIAKDIRTALKNETSLSSDLSKIKIEVYQGVVTLSGSAKTADEKVKIGSIALQTLGVKTVVNNLQVEG